MKSRLDLERTLKSLGLNNVFCSDLLDLPNKLVHLDSRQILFKKGQRVNTIYLVLYGALRLQNSENADDDNVIYAFRRAGSLLGIFTYIEKSHCHTATAVSVESTSLLEFPADYFLKKVDENPALREEVHRQIALNFKELQYDREMQREPATVRLADFLVKLLNYQKDLQSRSILMKLTKKDLAKKIGSEPETVVRLLSDWAKKGIIKSQNRMIEVCKLEELQRLAQR